MKNSIIFTIVTVAIISVSITSISAQSQMEIPAWVKNNALWWGEGQISDSDYFQGLQYLADNGFLQITSDDNSDYVAELEQKLESANKLKDRYQQGMIDLKQENERLEQFIESLQSHNYQSDVAPTQSQTYPDVHCYGNAGCYKGHVSQITDGDTMEIDGASVRLVLIDTPERGDYGYDHATDYLESLCPVGSPVVIDVDDWQESDRYDRILGVVYCDVWNLNEEMLASGWADVYEIYCSESEFGGHSWVKQYGCNSSYQNTSPSASSSSSTVSSSSSSDCDPSYPDFCIPSPPPDLNCGDIHQKRFTVLQPDPHRFDGDKDGIGCES